MGEEEKRQGEGREVRLITGREQETEERQVTCLPNFGSMVL